MKKTGVPEEGMIGCGSRSVEEELPHQKKSYCRIDSCFFFLFLEKSFFARSQTIVQMKENKYSFSV